MHGSSFSLFAEPWHSFSKAPVLKSTSMSHFFTHLALIFFSVHSSLQPSSLIFSPSSSIMSPTSPSRSRLRRTKSTSALSPKSRTLHSERQFPTTHPTVREQKVVWKQTPAVRMPQRAPGPQTMKMQTFMPPQKKVSSGYGIGGHGGAIQNVPIYQS